MVDIELFTFFQNVVSSPSCVDLLTKNRDQVATASNLAGRNDRSVAAVLAARMGCLVHPMFGVWRPEWFEPFDVSERFWECSILRWEIEDYPHLRNIEVSKEIQ